MQRPREVQMKTLAIAAIILASSTAFAQSPYSGLQSRPIKSLSEQQVSDLQAGRGMGLALAAELNGYPGPSHVLELADQLGLSTDQTARVQTLFDSMKQEALPVGARLIEQESELDRQFANRVVTPASLKSATAGIAATQGVLRETHLKYHLSTAEILTAAQMHRYAELRGYASAGLPRHHHQ
jgi:hypothetical protein